MGKCWALRENGLPIKLHKWIIKFKLNDLSVRIVSNRNMKNDIAPIFAATTDPTMQKNIIHLLLIMKHCVVCTLPRENHHNIVEILIFWRSECTLFRSVNSIRPSSYSGPGQLSISFYYSPLHSGTWTDSAAAKAARSSIANRVSPILKYSLILC